MRAVPVSITSPVVARDEALAIDDAAKIQKAASQVCLGFNTAIDYRNRNTRTGVTGLLREMSIGSWICIFHRGVQRPVRGNVFDIGIVGERDNLGARERHDEAVNEFQRLIDQASEKRKLTKKTDRRTVLVLNDDIRLGGRGQCLQFGRKLRICLERGGQSRDCCE